MTDATHAAHAAHAAERSHRELIDKNLASSVFIYQTLNTHLKEHPDQPELTLSRKELLKMRRAAVIVNQSLGAIVKTSRERENRLVVEQHLIRQSAQRDRLDHQAHRARVFERLRATQSEDASASAGAAGDVRAATASASANVGVERALRAVSHIEGALAQLSPTGTIKLHGAAALAACARARASGSG
jgi:hypothetical protein